MTEDEATILLDQIYCLCKLGNDELSSWEANFVDSVSKTDVWKLSDKQKEMIERFYSKYC